MSLHIVLTRDIDILSITSHNRGPNEFKQREKQEVSVDLLDIKLKQMVYLELSNLLTLQTFIFNLQFTFQFTTAVIFFKM